MPKDLYAVLGVSKTASAEDVKSAYRTLVKQLHPDLHPGDQKRGERFREVASAYEILGDEEKRRKYDNGEIDAEGQQAPAGGQYYRDFANRGGARQYQSHAGFEDLGDVSDLFSDLFGQGGRVRNGRGRNVSYKLDVDFLTAANGGQTRINLPDGKPLNVAIPEGVTDGQVLRLKGLGEPGQGTAPAGDALIEVHVKPHPQFVRQGDDVMHELAVSIDEAVLGAKVEVPTIKGRVAVVIPKGASSGQVLRLKGKGLKNRAGGHGDQLMKLKVVLPKVIDSELETFMKGWQERNAFNPRSDVS
jgi:DnaJ-class molecular chaperone